MSKSGSREPTILLVEDDSNLRERLASALRVHGCCVHATADLTEAVRATDIYAFDYAVVEPKSSEALLRRLRQSSPELSILVFTGYRKAASQVMRDLGVHFLQKPADADDVLCALGVDFDTADASSYETSSPAPS